MLGLKMAPGAGHGGGLELESRKEMAMDSWAHAGRTLTRQALESARYEDALSTLLEADPVEGMSEAEYRRWAYAVWEVLQHRADLS